MPYPLTHETNRFHRTQPRQKPVGFLGYWLLPWVLAGFLAVGLLWLLLRLKSFYLAPIEHVVIHSNSNNIKPSEVSQVLQGQFAGNFFTFKAQQVRAQLLALQWTQEVSIRRIWPDKLIVNITAYDPIAHWGEQGFITAQGDIFFPSHLDSHLDLPFLSGPKGVEKQLVVSLQQFNRAARVVGLSIKSLAVSDRLSWMVVWDNGMQVFLGSDEPEKQLLRFLRLYPKLIEHQSGQVEYVDMRYPNGLAVRWKEHAPAQNS